MAGAVSGAYFGMCLMLASGEVVFVPPTIGTVAFTTLAGAAGGALSDALLNAVGASEADRAALEETLLSAAFGACLVSTLPLGGGAVRHAVRMLAGGIAGGIVGDIVTHQQPRKGRR